MDDLQKNVEIRNKQFQESKNFADKNEDDDDDDEEEEEGSQYVAGTGQSKEPTARQSLRQGGALIFTREKQEAYQPKLQDFIIMKMVGKGTFGKVFLVQNMHTKKIYAMKCIRKDIVIDNE